MSSICVPPDRSEAILSQTAAQCRLCTHYNDNLYHDHIHHFHYAATEDMVKFSKEMKFFKDQMSFKIKLQLSTKLLNQP